MYIIIFCSLASNYILCVLLGNERRRNRKGDQFAWGPCLLAQLHQLAQQFQVPLMAVRSKGRSPRSNPNWLFPKLQRFWGKLRLLFTTLRDHLFCFFFSCFTHHVKQFLIGEKIADTSGCFFHWLGFKLYSWRPCVHCHTWPTPTGNHPHKPLLEILSKTL